MENTKITTFYDLRPAYYDDFHCLAGGCKWTCCKGWSITFDKKDYLSLKHQKYSPELSKKMGHSLCRMKEKDPIFNHYAKIRLLEDGVCPLQREDGLCALQVEKGAGALPEVCKIFPRAESHSFSHYYERSLSLGCEGVAALLWDLPEGIDFRSDPLPENLQKVTPLPKDNKLLPYFQDIRSLFIDYLQDRRFTLPSRIFMVGLAIQELLSAEDIPQWLAFAQTLPENPDINQLLEIAHSESVLRLFLMHNLKILLETQPPDIETIQISYELLSVMGVSGNPSKVNADSTAYLLARKKYAEIFAGRDYFMENIMVSLFFHLRIPDLGTPEKLWKSYVNFCNLYSFYRFVTTFSCREGVSDEKAELFRLVVMVSRMLLHNSNRQNNLRDELFKHESVTLAHMSVLLSE